MRCFFLMLFIITIITENQAQIGGYLIQNYSPADYLAGNQNIDFAQNRNHGLFIANNLGILSYDGKRWTTHDFKSGKKKRSLAFDKTHQKLYVGNQGDFGYYKADWTYHSLLHLLPPDLTSFEDVWDTYILNDLVYFCTFKYIFIYDGKSINIINSESKGGFDRSFKVDDKIFTQSSKGQLYEIVNGQLVSNLPQKIESQIVSGMLPHDEGYMVFYNSGQVENISFLDSDQKSLYELQEVLNGTYVNHVLRLSDNRIAISTQTAGLFIYDLETDILEQISENDGLETNACLRSFQDHSGNLWIGLQNGVAMVHINSPIKLINQNIGLQGSGYDCFEDEDGMYFSTSNGLYFIPIKSKTAEFLEGTEGPAYSIRKIGSHLYAGHHTGLFRLENGQAIRIAELNGLWDLKNLHADPQIVIGGTYSGLFLFQFDENDKLVPIGKIQGFDESSRFFEEDKKGRIVIGQYYKGIYRVTMSEDYRSCHVFKFKSNNDLPIDEQIIVSKVENEIYISTNKGLYHLNQYNDSIARNHQFSTITQDHPIYLFQQTDNNRIYLLTEETIGLFDPKGPGNYDFFPSSLYQSRFYFNNDLLHLSSNLSEGVIFSANEGFINYTFNNEKKLNSDNSSIFISKVTSTLNNQDLFHINPFQSTKGIDDELIISYKDKILQFHVESYQYNEAKNHQFRYLLDGFDNQYSEWTNNDYKEYSNLKEGNYQLLIQTKDEFGKTITGEPFKFSIKPPFYKSLWAKIFYFCLGVGFLYFLNSLQKSKYRKKAQKVKTESENKIAQKQIRLAALEKQKEQELHQLKEENMKNQLDQLNKMLASSTMNLVVKNEFIDNIKEELKGIKKRGKNPETISALEKIVREIDTTLRLQEDWEQFEYHFDKVHGDFLQRLREKFDDLSPNEQKLCVFLRLNLNTKEIANLMGVSPRGVEIARYRLRKKLPLHKGENLSKYILDF